MENEAYYASYLRQGEMAKAMAGGFAPMIGGSFARREKGGPVKRGKTYVVNERGQESFVADQSPGKIKPLGRKHSGPALFTPPTDGTVLTHQKTKSALRRLQGRTR